MSNDIAECGEWLGASRSATLAEAFDFATEVANEWRCHVTLRVHVRTPTGVLLWDVFAA